MTYFCGQDYFHYCIKVIRMIFLITVMRTWGGEWCHENNRLQILDYSNKNLIGKVVQRNLNNNVLLLLLLLINVHFKGI